MFSKKKNGTFLEIGAGDPVYGNNTYILHNDYNWQGISIDYGYNNWNEDVIITCNEVFNDNHKSFLPTTDNQQFTREEWIKYWDDTWNLYRKNQLIMTDALSCNWKEIIEKNYNLSEIDYLQIDIDPAENTYKCLTSLPFDDISFKVITYEHDAYKDDTWRLKSRKFLESKGYILVAGNITVKNSNLPYEDWWINLKFFDQIKPNIDIKAFEDFLSAEKYINL